ncbi:flap endonuclease 1-like isoform X2 [Scyliorhinus torazame]|uniref:flap endonuclease 1-like isoform X2 n=1 Tax=Scyliorhinus torazame TaxID=75743 RepID=UPI003B5CE3C0
MALDAAVVMNQFRTARPDKRQVIGVFYRTASLLEKGIKPVFVFDGPAPRMKFRVLCKRRGWTPVTKSPEAARKGSVAARELCNSPCAEPVDGATGPTDRGECQPMESEPQRLMTAANGAEGDVNQNKGQQVTETTAHTQRAGDGRAAYVPRTGRRDCQRLLTLLGVPYIEAPSEAEATCAALVKAGKVHCTATEDMDALPFGCTRLVRNVSAKKDARVEEISLPEILKSLDLTQEQFVDLCILLGCDYCDKIKGIGLKRALPLIQSHKSIEEIIRNIDCLKYIPPEGWPFREARELFLQPMVVNTDEVTLEWSDLDEEGLVQLLVHEKKAKYVSSFRPQETSRRPRGIRTQEKRVRNRIQRLRESLRGVERRCKTFTAERQTRLDEFYTKVKTYNYKKEDESYFRTTLKRRKAVKRNLGRVPLRRYVRVQGKATVPSMLCEPALPTQPAEAAEYSRLSPGHVT